MVKVRTIAKALLVIGLALTFMPGPAWSLSCMAPDLKQSYAGWAKSDTRFVIARGVLLPAAPLPEKRRNSVKEQENEFLQAVPYTFNGVLVGKNGNTPVSIAVTVEPRCLAVWCGGYPERGEEILYAFEVSSNGYRYSPSPCGGDAFSGDVTAHEKTVRQCMASGTCGG